MCLASISTFLREILDMALQQEKRLLQSHRSLSPVRPLPPGRHVGQMGGSQTTEYRFLIACIQVELSLLPIRDESAGVSAGSSALPIGLQRLHGADAADTSADGRFSQQACLLLSRDQRRGGIVQPAPTRYGKRTGQTEGENKDIFLAHCSPLYFCRFQGHMGMRRAERTANQAVLAHL